MEMKQQVTIVKLPLSSMWQKAGQEWNHRVDLEYTTEAWAKGDSDFKI
jgi:hypothetical protein